MIKRILVFVPLYVGWVLVTLYLLFGLWKAWTLQSTLTQLLAMLVYLVLVLIGMWPFYRWVLGAPGWTKKVMAHGKHAQAIILSVKGTGLVVNYSSAVVRLRLRVEPPGEAPFEVSQEKLVSMINGLQGYSVGDHVEVKYDPDNRKHLIIGGNARSGH